MYHTASFTTISSQILFVLMRVTVLSAFADALSGLTRFTADAFERLLPYAGKRVALKPVMGDWGQGTAWMPVSGWQFFLSEPLTDREWWWQRECWNEVTVAEAETAYAVTAIGVTLSNGYARAMVRFTADGKQHEEVLRKGWMQRGA